jgi:hypothetical protein
MHEIITLQFGQQANYVGSHYWNTQESYFTYSDQETSPVDHDISFRPGVGADGADTYAPRTVIYDLKGAFGTLRRENALYELQHEGDPARQNPWGRNVVPLHLPTIEGSAYQQALESGGELPALSTQSVRFWSDYNHVYYHPKSIVQLNEYEVNSSLMPFERYQTGEELFANLDREHDLLDRDLRPFLEECDQVQAIQVFASTDDAWGGFTARYLERIADDLGKGCRWVFGLEDGKRTTRERRILQTTNVAQSIYSIVPSASMYVPITSLPSQLPAYLAYDTGSRWHTSALQAAVVETATLSGRLKSGEQGHARLDEVESDLAGNGTRPIAEASLSAKDPADLSGAKAANGDHDNRMTNGYVNGTSSHDRNDDFKPDISFLPEVPRTTRSHQSSPRRKFFTRSEATRGLWHSSLEVQDANLASRDRFASGPRTTIHQSALLFPVLPSYPAIFSMPGLTDKLALSASLSTSTRVAQHVREFAGVVRMSYALEEREAVYDGLVCMAEEYEENMDDLGSEESDGE